MAIVDRYVHTSSTGGNGTTQATSGANAAYASWNAWEAAEQTDLVSDGDIARVGLAGGSDSTAVTISGWTTGTSNYILARGDPSAPGSDGANTGNTFSTSFYYKEQSSTATNDVNLTISEEYVRIEDMQFLHSSASGNYQRSVRVATIGASNDIQFNRCRFEKTGSSVGPHGIRNDDPNADIHTNACVFNWATGTAARAIMESSSDASHWNNTFYNCEVGIVTFNNSHPEVKNCAFISCNDDIGPGSGTWDIQYCVGNEDLDSISGGSNNQQFGVSGFTSEADSFEDPSNGDFRLKTGSSCIDAGTTGGPTNDLLGNAYGTADIGCFAGTAAAGGGGYTSQLALMGVGF